MSAGAASIPHIAIVVDDLGDGMRRDAETLGQSRGPNEHGARRLRVSRSEEMGADARHAGVAD